MPPPPLQDALPLLRKWLKEALRQEGVQPSLRSKAGSVPVSELLALVADLSGSAPDFADFSDSPGGSGGGIVPSIEGGVALAAPIGEAETGLDGHVANGGEGHAVMTRGNGGGSAALRHRGLLSLSAAVASAASGPYAVRWEAAAALERQVLALMVQVGSGGGGGGGGCCAMCDQRVTKAAAIGNYAFYPTCVCRPGTLKGCTKL